MGEWGGGGRAGGLGRRSGGFYIARKVGWEFDRNGKERSERIRGLGRGERALIYNKAYDRSVDLLSWLIGK